VTKTEDFIIDWSDEKENVLICSPCSGHGFKFSTVIGKIISDLVISDQSINIFEKNRHKFRVAYHLGMNLE
jgi:glycine/D-amino acid oxidase-like deaminating enzyme